MAKNSFSQIMKGFIMKNNTMKKTILSKIAIIAFTMMAPILANDHHLSKVDNVINVFMPTEKLLARYFNSSDKTPNNTFVEELDSILRDFQRKIEAVTRSHNDDISVAIDELMDYVAQHFNVLCNIFKKYNGKPASYAADFSIEIKREFNTEKIFGEMITKLKALRAKASHTDNKHLVKKIDCLSQLIQKKKAEWSAKPDWVLFAGLTTRLNCR
jgi:hypothetical protein